MRLREIFEGGAAIPITDIDPDDLKLVRRYCDEVEQRMISSSSESERAADTAKDDGDGDNQPSSQQPSQTHSTSTTYPTHKPDAKQSQGSDSGPALGGRQVLSWEDGWGSDLNTWWRKPNTVELSEFLTGEGMWGGYEGYKAWYEALREPLTLEVLQ
ncbi:hypothetical protein HDV00_007966 [Rhizophlyctis rosea]|nr:hypothetical protein HDV00_007966 [Rhizophlyctis rosea]